MSCTFLVNKFEELSLAELYELLQLRSAVFVVEQTCIYADIDGKDDKALHILGKVDGEIVAYARCFPPGVYFEEAAIGRVLVKENFRGKSFAHRLMCESVKAIHEIFKTFEIRISAQQYLIEFYKAHGFSVSGKGYLEDGIPHIQMFREK